METKVKIRHRHFVKKQSIHQITKELGISRNTVRRILREEDNTAYKRKSVVLPKLGSHQTQLDEWLKADATLPRKQRSHAVKLHERLKEKGYDGSYDSVQRYVKAWKIKERQAGNTAYIPLIFGLGEAYQFDWSDEIVELAGVVQKIMVGHFRLSYSRLNFLVAYPLQRLEMVFDAHRLAFEFFDGIPQRGIYDNMKTAVNIVFKGKKREFNVRFMEMMNHYRIEPTACSPAAGWEKGQIENQVRGFRGRVFVPRLKVSGFTELNQYLREQCLEDAKKRLHVEQAERTVWSVYEEERALLQPLLPPFEGYVESFAKVKTTCLVHVDCNRYSVDSAYVNQVVTIRSYADKLVFLSEDNIIGEHMRCFERNKTLYNPWHYVPILERKPGALRNGAPFLEWELPKGFRQVQEKLMRVLGGDKECVKLLLQIQEHGMEAMGAACELAINDNVIQVDYIINLLNRLKPTATVEPAKTPESLWLAIPPLANCERYNTLLERI